MFGATRFTNSSHLLAIEGPKLVNPVRLLPGRDGDGRRIGQDHVRPQIEQLFGELARMHDVARTPAIDELDVAALYPAQGVKGLLENHDPRLSFRVIRNSHQYANAPHAIRLLRA